jgi:hypothetical protein
VTYREEETAGYVSGDGNADPSSGPKRRKSQQKSTQKGKRQRPKREGPNSLASEEAPRVQESEQAAVGGCGETSEALPGVPMPQVSAADSDGHVTPGATSSEQEPPPDSDSNMNGPSGASSKHQTSADFQG